MNDNNSNSANNASSGRKNPLSDQSEAILRLLSDRGLLEDENISESDVRQAVMAKRSKKFHNTQMLLKHYRDISWVMECLPAMISADLDRRFIDLDNLLGLINAEICLDNVKVENRLMNIQQSRLMLDRIHEALTILRQKPGNGEELYNCVYLTFIARERLNLQEILDRMKISARHYYRLRKQAVNILSIRLWAAPNFELDAWLEILSLLDTVNGKRVKSQ